MNVEIKHQDGVLIAANFLSLVALFVLLSVQGEFSNLS